MTRQSDVGYSRPPKANRFKPGKSGNPKGRPTGSRNLATELKSELSKPVTVRENGQAKKVSKRVALIKSLIAKGLSGDVKAIGVTLQLNAQMEQQAPAAAPISVESDELRILRHFAPRAVKTASTKRTRR
ncbi:MAG TPA: DUF5681 domain-containing protein [Rhizomicrobium sp.]|jgi:hypothetical protein|nr:DUF5681 domain-containing protein [Rhizomicrobium sp.]